ncbi:MAG: hypothetical protein Q8N53_06655, partial [Longimicrobiales bacterium]|nr:hypothetical protein [Longimicrobiales bacterium]
GPHTQVGEAPTAGTPAATHTQRSRWALDRLWEGLAGPSDAAWAAGSEVLMDTPMPQPSSGVDAAQAAQLAKRVQELGGDGRQARTAEERESREWRRMGPAPLHKGVHGFDSGRRCEA